MGRTDFDKELSNYLSRRKKGSIPDVLKWIRGLMPKPTPPPVQVNLPKEIETYEEEIPKQRSTETIRQDRQERQTVLSFLLEKLTFSKKPVITQEEQDTKIKEIVAKEMIQKDLQKISKIALMAIKKLPEEDMKEFKNSAEFDTLKEILKKHDLIK
jgi:thiamine pyrophosphate-dependent acetolactate synthase large subunit-like protein